MMSRAFNAPPPNMAMRMRNTTISKARVWMTNLKPANSSRITDLTPPVAFSVPGLLYGCRSAFEACIALTLTAETKNDTALMVHATTGPTVKYSGDAIAGPMMKERAKVAWVMEAA